MMMTFGFAKVNLVAVMGDIAFPGVQCWLATMRLMSPQCPAQRFPWRFDTFAQRPGGELTKVSVFANKDTESDLGGHLT
jgi:hypothetical protein